jgi:hypothetical protein
MSCHLLDYIVNTDAGLSLLHGQLVIYLEIGVGTGRAMVKFLVGCSRAPCLKIQFLRLGIFFYYTLEMITKFVGEEEDERVMVGVSLTKVHCKHT